MSAEDGLFSLPRLIKKKGKEEDTRGRENRLLLWGRQWEIFVPPVQAFHQRSACLLFLLLLLGWADRSKWNAFQARPIYDFSIHYLYCNRPSLKDWIFLIVRFLFLSPICIWRTIEKSHQDSIPFGPHIACLFSSHSSIIYLHGQYGTKRKLYRAVVFFYYIYL